MPRERRHVPLLVWLGVSALLHSGTVSGVREVARRIVRSAPAPRLAMGSSPIELEFEPADAVRPNPSATAPTPTEAVPVPSPTRSPPTARERSAGVRPTPEDDDPLARRAPPPPPPPRPETPVRVIPRVAPPMPDRAQQWANQAQGNNEAAPDGLLAQTNNNVAEETIRRSQERAAERHIEGREAINVAGQPRDTPPARPTPRPPRAEAARSPNRAATASSPPPSGPTKAEREAGSLRGQRGAVGTPGDGRAVGAAGSPGALAAAGATVRTLGTVDTAGGRGGLTGAGATSGEAGQGGAGGTGGAQGSIGERGQGGVALLRGTGGAGNAPTRRVGIEGLGAARALAALTPTVQTLDAVYGRDALDRWLREDQRRRADARGDYASNWRAAVAAIDTPVSVRPGETTALRTRASPFAAYIVQLHERIHERFAEGFIGRIMSMPSTSPLQNPALHTELEIVINRDGTIQRLAVARPSGTLVFDVGAIDSVRHAAPFPPPPDVILSGDGHVYVHWHFRRSENFCNDARPFILRGRGAAPEPALPRGVGPLIPEGGEPTDGGVPTDRPAPPDAAEPPPSTLPEHPGAQRAA